MQGSVASPFGALARSLDGLWGLVGAFAVLSYHSIDCPFCGERFEIGVDPAALGQMIQDCDVCCRPIRLDIQAQPEAFDAAAPDEMNHPFEQRVLVRRGS